MPGFRAAGILFICWGLLEYMADAKVLGIMTIATGLLMLWLRRRQNRRRGAMPRQGRPGEEYP